MKKILIVDDDTALRQTLALLFESVSASQCTLASSFEEAKSILPDISSYRLAVLDVNLNDDKSSGVDVFHWLTQNHFDGKIVFFTGHARSHRILWCSSPAARLASN
jgi:FixJ family two-component response regulator